jgi:hypothetical protein
MDYGEEVWRAGPILDFEEFGEIVGRRNVQAVAESMVRAGDQSFCAHGMDYYSD